MPDIAMCEHRTCPSRALCYRHADSGTRPGYWQSYSAFAPAEGADACDRFWPIRSTFVEAAAKEEDPCA